MPSIDISDLDLNFLHMYIHYIYGWMCSDVRRCKALILAFIRTTKIPLVCGGSKRLPIVCMFPGSKTLDVGGLE